MVIGEFVEGLIDWPGAIGRALVRDSQILGLGPEKGIPHMAAEYIINALWDIVCKVEGTPLWQVLPGLSPEQLVEFLDFRRISDASNPEEALALFQKAQPLRQEREGQLLSDGLPAYTTTPGCLAYDCETMVRPARETVADRFRFIKLKGGGSLFKDRHRIELMPEAVGPDITLGVDANQEWDVPEAIAWIRGLEDDQIHWVEEPTRPDDIVGHKAI